MMEFLYTVLKVGVVMGGSVAIMLLLVVQLEEKLLAASWDTDPIGEAVRWMIVVDRVFLILLTYYTAYYIVRLRNPLAAEQDPSLALVTVFSLFNQLLWVMFGFFLAGATWFLLGRVREREEAGYTRVLDRRRRLETERRRRIWIRRERGGGMWRRFFGR